MAIDTEAKRWSMLALANSPGRTHVFNPETSGLVSIERITVLQKYGGIAWSASESAGITGSLSLLENQVTQGFREVYVTLSGATWVDFDAQRQNVINGLSSAQTEDFGWNNEVRDKIETPALTKITDEIARLLLPASSAYQITSNETITWTIPATANSSGSALTATPTISVSAAADSGAAIVNTDATTDVPSNYEIDDRTGFRVRPGKLRKDGYGFYTSEKYFDRRHPQEFVRSVPTTEDGPDSPEQDDIDVGTVTVDDL